MASQGILQENTTFLKGKGTLKAEIAGMAKI
jgi:hypothetical protein